MNKTEMFNTIDREAYILKNKIMQAFDRTFGTNLSAKDADDLSFVDILMAVNNQSAEAVYALLKRIAGHGVSFKQKDFLYEHTNMLFLNECGYDFEDLMEKLAPELDKVEGLVRVDGIPVDIKGNQGPFQIICHKGPFWILEYVGIVPKDVPVVEALLVQNGQVMVLRTEHQKKEIPWEQIISLYPQGGIPS